MIKCFILKVSWKYTFTIIIMNKTIKYPFRMLLILLTCSVLSLFLGSQQVWDFHWWAIRWRQLLQNKEVKLVERLHPTPGRSPPWERKEDEVHLGGKHRSSGYLGRDRRQEHREIRVQCQHNAQQQGQEVGPCWLCLSAHTQPKSLCYSIAEACQVQRCFNDSF